MFLFRQGRKRNPSTLFVVLLDRVDNITRVAKNRAPLFHNCIGARRWAGLRAAHPVPIRALSLCTCGGYAAHYHHGHDHLKVRHGWHALWMCTCPRAFCERWFISCGVVKWGGRNSVVGGVGGRKKETTRFSNVKIPADDAIRTASRLSSPKHMTEMRREIS